MENSLKNFDETEAEMPDFNAAILEALAASNLPIASSNRLSQIPTPAIIPSEHSKFFENSKWNCFFPI